MATATKQCESVDLLETAYSGALQVDEENAVIRGVKILGRESGNKGPTGKPREYSAKAIRESIRLYEGKEVNFNHPDRNAPGVERSVEDRAGWLSNVRESKGDIVGDLHYLKSDARSGKIVEAAKRRPELFGLSHNARGNEVVRGGKSIVESIDLVRSVDIVTRPATTSSLFESEQTMPTSLKELAESLDEQDAGRSLLLETMGDDDDDLAGLKKIAAALLKCKADAGQAAPTMESQIFESIEMLDAAGIKAARPLVQSLAALKTTAERTALIESLPRGAAADAKRKPAVGTVTRSGGKADSQGVHGAPQDHKEFLKSITY